MGDWLLVKYSGVKIEKYFIGNIVEIYEREQQYQVKFLKKLQGKLCRFIENEDIDIVEVDMIIRKIPPPLKRGSEKRFYFEFPIDLSSFEIL